MTTKMTPGKLPTQACSKRKKSLDNVETSDEKRVRTDEASEEDPKPVEVLSNEDLIKKLHVAVKKRDISLVRELLKQKPECGVLLWEAVLKNRDTEITTMLVHAGTNILTTYKEDYARPTLLHVLAMQSNNPKKYELLKLLIERGARINQRDKRSYSVLYYAVRHMTDPLAFYKEWFANKKAEIDSTVLALVAAKPNFIEYLSVYIWSSNLKYNKEALVENRVVTTIEFITYFDGDENLILPAVKWLLGLKPSVRKLDTNALFVAVLYKKVGMVKLLIEYGADVNAKANEGHSLICMAMRHKTSEIAELLIRNGVKIHSATRYDRLCKPAEEVYPIHIACEYGRGENVQLLLRSGVDVNVLDQSGKTPFAAIRDWHILTDAHRVMIKHFSLMLAKGLDITKSDRAMIHRYPHLIKFASECSAEVEKMEKTEIIKNFSCVSFFIKDIREITLLVKSQKYLDSFNECQYKELFPIFSSDIDWIIENALKRKAVLAEKEEALTDSVGEFLPDLVIEKIMYHLCLIDS